VESEEGESVVPFPREEGSSGRWQHVREVAAAVVPGRLPEEEESRAADRAGPSISEGEVEGQARPKGGGREVGRGWAENRKWLN
jgi:hypothetical protein